MSLRREWLKNNGKYYEGNVIYTKSTHFIMPMIGYFSGDFIGVNGHVNHLINCYLDIENNRIAIVLDNTDDSNIVRLLNNNELNHYYDSSTMDDSDKEIVLFFNIPENCMDDYKIFLSSKYSKMSKEYKERLVNYYGRQSNTSNYKPSQFDVLYPTPYKRKQWAEHLGVDISLMDEVGEVYGEIDMNYESYKTIEQLTNKLTNIQDNIKYESK